MILPFKDKNPQIDSSVYIVDSAVVVGDVVIGEESSVWFNAVVRGDVNYIRIGRRTNIQDGCVLHVSRKDYPLVIGDGVTVGHNVTLHACTIASNCLIGMGAVVMDGSDIGQNCIIGAGALVTPHTVISPGNMAVGSPAKVKRKLSEEEIQSIRDSAEHYVSDIQSYLSK
ncbi:MAG TPA: gamma carbonic anhydrase family protein [Nitrospinaceae bacterium]|jgi:carbonic anhydrase/acetyltransferase-like protein (isoleucine patch superfamily)|nr:gamma carbonic anhydrase family protein [Nitrospinaceae bacterium]HJL73269.1 gamma carbonic anhydrase family protein [Nitrospinaceae bacterium]HJN99270.1 gamma carbonic anhydrase family protein [Nitrospinaceae bacterium]|tara:strand:+ start:3648 stop:4157 length:510 start_codon:yes stop_codon:yes gene_type:complete